MMPLALWAVVGLVGVLVVIRGLFPPRPSLKDYLATPDANTASTSGMAFRSMWGRVGLWLVRAVQRDKLEHSLKADLAVTETDLETFAIDKLNAAIGTAAILSLIGWLLGWASSIVAVAILVVAGFAIGFLLPDMEISSKAARRRDEFREALTAFVSLVAVCISGGGGVNSAMSDALQVGGDWTFRMLREAFDASILMGEDVWTGFDRLGRELGVEELIELAGALGLAGTSGARVTETLKARAEASRDKERQLVLTAAEKKSERMNIPVAVLAFSWMVFVGYPALAGLIGS